MSNRLHFTMDATGNVGKDPQQSYTPNGKMKTTTSIAVETGSGDFKKTVWVYLTVWGEKAGGWFKKMVKKGTRIRVTGEPSAFLLGEDAAISIVVREWDILKNGRPKDEDEEDETPYDGEDEE